MSNVGVIPAIKSTNEDCLTTITSNGQYLGEVVDTINHTSQNINKKLDSMSTAINLDLETFTQMKNSLSSNTMLLTEVLKVPFFPFFYRFFISFYITPNDFLPFRSFQALGFHPPHEEHQLWGHLALPLPLPSFLLLQALPPNFALTVEVHTSRGIALSGRSSA